MAHIKVKNRLSIEARFNMIFSIITLFLPWPIRKFLLVKLLHFEIDKSCRIGFSLIFPKKLRMEANASIGHFNLCKGLEYLELGKNSSIGNLNWISAYPKEGRDYFSHQPDRSPELVLGDESSVTHRHILDCSNSVRIGKYSIVGGNRSQIITHSINLIENRQHSLPVKIGEYCFIGSGSIIIGGGILPDHSVLGAKSLLNKPYFETGYLYGGVPARKIKKYADSAEYFKRKTGHVH